MKDIQLQLNSSCDEGQFLFFFLLRNSKWNRKILSCKICFVLFRYFLHSVLAESVFIRNIDYNCSDIFGHQLWTKHYMAEFIPVNKLEHLSFAVNTQMHKYLTLVLPFSEWQSLINLTIITFYLWIETILTWPTNSGPNTLKGGGNSTDIQ